MFRTALTTASVVTFAFTGAASAGTITGKLKLKADDKQAVVYVESATGTFAAPKGHAQMDQKGMMFIPYILPVLVGTTVDFLNSDSVNHNVFTPDNEAYNLGTWPKGSIKSYTFKRAGVYTQLCSIHPEMEAFIVVLPNPYFATVDKDGNFKIDGVPDGHYSLKVFAKKLKKADKERKFPVDVKGTTTVGISF